MGGLAGSILGGAAAGKVTNTVVGVFVEDDADEMVKIIENVFTEMASEYLLSQKEAEKSVDCLRDKLDGKTLKNMYASSDKKKICTKSSNSHYRKRNFMPNYDSCSYSNSNDFQYQGSP